MLVFDRKGNVYYAGLVFNISSSGTLGNTVAFVAKYSNDGATYAGTTSVIGPLFADKEWLAVDNTGGANDGNVYLAFDANLTASSYFGTLFSRSTDGGKTFSPPFYAPGDETGELPGVAVDGAGNVYVSSDAFNPVTEANLNYIQVSKITNGGTVLAQTVKVVNPASWLTGPPQGASFRAFTIPQMAADSSGVYMVFDDTRLGNVSVFLTRSVDGGTTWTTPLRVNDALNGQHFFPAIAVVDGIINVAWYDSRLNTGTTITTLDVYYSYSLDGGMMFSPNLRATDVSFNPETVQRSDQPGDHNIFMGDYIQISASPFTAHIIWTDNRFACDTFDPIYGCVDQDAFTAGIIFPSSVGGLTLSPNTLRLLAPYLGLSIVSLVICYGIFILSRKIRRGGHLMQTGSGTAPEINN